MDSHISKDLLGTADFAYDYADLGWMIMAGSDGSPKVAPMVAMRGSLGAGVPIDRPLRIRWPKMWCLGDGDGRQLKSSCASSRSQW